MDDAAACPQYIRSLAAVRFPLLRANYGNLREHRKWNNFGVARGNTMRLARRGLLLFAGAALAAPVLSLVAKAHAYPVSPITMIVPYPASNQLSKKASAELTAASVPATSPAPSDGYASWPPADF
jgi:hypothetical protein